MNLPNPVIRSHYRNRFIKQYVRAHLMLRTEAASNDVNDYGVKKAKKRYRRSTTTTSTSNRISWKPLSIAASCESSRNRRSRRPESASQASSSITLGNSP